MSESPHKGSKGPARRDQPASSQAPVGARLPGERKPRQKRVRKPAADLNYAGADVLESGPSEELSGKVLIDRDDSGTCDIERA